MAAGCARLGGGGSLNGALYAVGGVNAGAQTNVYRYPRLTVSPGVSPSSGSTAGGYQVTITGTDLGDGADITNVTLCGVAAGIVSQSGDGKQVVVTAGAGVAGVGDVVVYSASRGATAKINAFAYIAPLETVSAPTAVSGAGNTLVGQSESYTASGAVSSEGHGLEYRFDWGDAAISAWGSASQSHSWSVAGAYGVKAQARCATEHWGGVGVVA